MNLYNKNCGKNKELTIQDTFNNPDFSDIEICVGDKTFYASKFLLRIHSSKFRNDLRDEKKHCESLEINKLDPILFEQVLKFIYGIEIENLKEISCDLFLVAYWCGVQELVQLCTDTIKKITVESLQKTIDFSFQCRLSKLQQKCIEFIVEELKKDQDAGKIKMVLAKNPEISWQVIDQFKNQLEKANSKNI